MKSKILMIIVVIFAVNSNIYTQELSKTEKKNLKKELRTLLKDPVQYKLLKESLTLKENIIREQDAELLALENENAKNKNRLELVKDSIRLCTLNLEKVEMELNSLKTSGGFDNKGMKFKLQIGKYRDFDISSFFEKNKFMTFEKDENGLFTYTIGNFETEEKAELFKKAMRDLGIKDAFVSHYIEGVRVSKDK